jgi:hypothetical protein
VIAQFALEIEFDVFCMFCWVCAALLKDCRRMTWIALLRDSGVASAGVMNTQVIHLLDLLLADIVEVDHPGKRGLKPAEGICAAGI